MSLSCHFEPGSPRRDMYRVERRDQCTLVFGTIPATDLMALTMTAPKDAVLSSDLALLAGANLAFGAPDAIDALSTLLRQEKRECIAPNLSTLSPAARTWLTEGEQGLSAATIFTRVTGVVHPILRGDRTPSDVPHDPADFRRCRLLLEAVPEIDLAFTPVMRAVSPQWQKLELAWIDLCHTMDEECPDWRRGEGQCPQTYAAMKQLQATVA